MADELNIENEPTPTQQPKTAPTDDKIGDTFYKERVKRRISIETLAKDLKLNVKYVKSIESNSFNDLPADPYVRVYLRSMATYLMLNADDVLRKYMNERGMSQGDDSRRIDVRLDQRKSKSPKTFLAVVGIIAALAGLTYIANEKGWITNTANSLRPSGAGDSTATDFNQLPPPTTDSLNPLLETGGDTIADTDVAEPVAPPAVDISSDKKSADTLKFVIHAIKDSVWVQVFCDGQFWRNYIRPEMPRTFVARDSINAHIGENTNLWYTLNGKRFTIYGTGVKIFKIDGRGTNLWTIGKWNSVFRNRF